MKAYVGYVEHGFYGVLVGNPYGEIVEVEDDGQWKDVEGHYGWIMFRLRLPRGADRLSVIRFGYDSENNYFGKLPFDQARELAGKTFRPCRTKGMAESWVRSMIELYSEYHRAARQDRSRPYNQGTLLRMMANGYSPVYALAVAQELACFRHDSGDYSDFFQSALDRVLGQGIIPRIIPGMPVYPERVKECAFVAGY